MPPSSTAAISTPAAQAAPSRWMLGPGQDLLLIVGTPLFVLPVVWLALFMGAASVNIQYVVLTFGSLGHNLPGMLRAYGDRALFQRFRTRFVVAPVVFISVCAGSVIANSSAIVVIAYFWAVWHGLMQIYGFMRIYDSKVGSTEQRTARLDLALCVVWFAGAVVFSGSRMYYVTSMLADYGVPALGASGMHALRMAMVALMAIVAFAHLGHRLSRKRAGKPGNPVKDLLILTSLGWWWFAHVITDDVLLGLVIFEVFHDVQYLTIVWIFNCRRVDSDPGIGRFTRFLFRRNWSMLGIYIGLVFAYGGMAPAFGGLGKSMDPDLVRKLATVVITSSALLHYYFDGFIWKVRESSTSSALSIGRTGREDRRVPTHALKWLLLFVPLGSMLWIGSDHRTIANAEALSETTPEVAAAQWNLGLMLNQNGEHERAIPVLERCLELEPEHAQARRNLALARMEVGKDRLREGKEAEARVLLQAGAADLPKIAALYTNHGLALLQEGRVTEAVVELRAAVTIEPDLAMAHLNLALAYRNLDQLESALEHARRGLALMPGDARAQQFVRELEGL